MKKLFALLSIFFFLSELSAQQLSTIINDAKTYVDTNIVNNTSRQITPLKLNISYNKLINGLKYIDTSARFAGGSGSGTNIYNSNGNFPVGKRTAGNGYGWLYLNPDSATIKANSKAEIESGQSFVKLENNVIELNADGNNNQISLDANTGEIRISAGSDLIIDNVDNTYLTNLPAGKRNRLLFVDNATGQITKGDTLGFMNVDTLSLSNRINLKLDSLTKSNDTIYQWKNNVRTFAFKDSSGGNSWNIDGNTITIGQWFGTVNSEDLIFKVASTDIATFYNSNNSVSFNTPNIGGTSSFSANGSTAAGDLSFAGTGGIANGYASTAFSGGVSSGVSSFGIADGTAEGQSSFASTQGRSVGLYSIAGANGRANGNYSTAIGAQLKSQGFNTFSIGRFNDSSSAASPTAYNALNRVFEVGIGTANNARANAMTVLFNGKTGIGNTTPDSTLDIFGSIKATGGVRFTGIHQTALDTTSNKIAVFASDGTLKKSYWQPLGNSLTNGNGTVISGSAVNLGGTLTQNTSTNYGDYYKVDTTAVNTGSSDIKLTRHFGNTPDAYSVFNSTEITSSNNGGDLLRYGIYNDGNNAFTIQGTEAASSAYIDAYFYPANTNITNSLSGNTAYITNNGIYGNVFGINTATTTSEISHTTDSLIGNYNGVNYFSFDGKNKKYTLHNLKNNVVEDSILTTDVRGRLKLRANPVTATDSVHNSVAKNFLWQDTDGRIKKATRLYEGGISGGQYLNVETDQGNDRWAIGSPGSGDGGFQWFNLTDNYAGFEVELSSNIAARPKLSFGGVSAARTYTFPNTAGTVALISDVNTKQNTLSGTGVVSSNAGTISYNAGTANQLFRRNAANTAYEFFTPTYISSYTETDPVVSSINGLVKSNGTTISAATAGTDYLTPTGSAATLTSFPTFNQNTTGTASNITATSNSTLTTLSSLSLPSSQVTGLAAIATSGSATDLNTGSIPAARYAATTIPVTAINATGGASTDFLRKDGTWATPSGGVSDGDKGDVVVSASGTVYNVESVNGELNLKGITSPSQFTADQDNASFTGSTIVRVSTNSDARVLTSISGGTDGRILKIINVGSSDLILQSDDGATGTAVNRFDFNGADVVIEPKEGRLLAYDATLSRWIKVAYEYDLTNVRRQPIYNWDYMVAGVATANFPTTAISTGTATYILTEAGHPGYMTTTSSTTTNSGNHSYYLGLQTNFFFQGGETYECIYQPKVASNTNTTTRFGFLDATTSADAVDGAYFEIPAGSFNVVGKTANNSTRTTSSTIATLSVNTWYRFKVTVNRASSSIKFEIFDANGVPLGSQSNTANIPTTSARAFGAGYISTNVGTVATLLGWLDYQAVQLGAGKAINR